MQAEGKTRKRKRGASDAGDASCTSVACSRAARAGLHFPVGRIGQCLKQKEFSQRVGGGAPVYVAAVLEYLTSSMLDAAGRVVQIQEALAAGSGSESSTKRMRTITPAHIHLAVRQDGELARVMLECTESAAKERERELSQEEVEQQVQRQEQQSEEPEEEDSASVSESSVGDSASSDNESASESEADDNGSGRNTHRHEDDVLQHSSDAEEEIAESGQTHVPAPSVNLIAAPSILHSSPSKAPPTPLPPPSAHQGFRSTPTPYVGAPGRPVPSVALGPPSIVSYAPCHMSAMSYAPALSSLRPAPPYPQRPPASHAHLAAGAPPLFQRGLDPNLFQPF